VSVFCRHNRFTADCPICSKDIPGASAATSSTRSSRRKTGSQRAGATAAAAVRGPYASAGPYEQDGATYEVRLERVPGGLRLAEWSGETLRRRAPVMSGSDLGTLVAGAAEKGLLAEGELARIAAGNGEGVSRGRAGEMREELRVEHLEGGRVRIGRWLYRPGTREWELQEAPPMLPSARYAEALAGVSGMVGA
jgi:hypothetical protein